MRPNARGSLSAVATRKVDSEVQFAGPAIRLNDSPSFECHARIVLGIYDVTKQWFQQSRTIVVYAVTMQV